MLFLLARLFLLCRLFLHCLLSLLCLLCLLSLLGHSLSLLKLLPLLLTLHLQRHYTISRAADLRPLPPLHPMKLPRSKQLPRLRPGRLHICLASLQLRSRIIPTQNADTRYPSWGVWTLGDVLQTHNGCLWLGILRLWLRVCWTWLRVLCRSGLLRQLLQLGNLIWVEASRRLLGKGVSRLLMLLGRACRLQLRLVAGSRLLLLHVYSTLLLQASSTLLNVCATLLLLGARRTLLLLSRRSRLRLACSW